MSSNLSSNFPQFIVEMNNGPGHAIYAFEDFRLDAEKLMLYHGDAEVTLPPKVIKTLAVLVENQGTILSKDELMEMVWTDSVVEESNLSQYLYLLRKTLGNKPDGHPYVETLRRRGYRFTAPVHLLKNEDAGTVPEPTVSTDPPRYEVVRSGNVLTLVDWKDQNERPVENGSLRETSQLPQNNRFLNRRSAMIAAAVFLILFASLTYSWYRSAKATTAEKSTDLTFLTITNGIEVNDATISPDGRYFVYHEQDGPRQRIWLQQTGYSNRIEIVPATEHQFPAKMFSPDGQFVYFVATDPAKGPNTLYRVPTLGGPQTKILTGIDSYVSFSPDGREMVFYRQNQETGETAYVIKASDGSGDERVLLAGNSKTPFFGNPAWSPDGKIIAFGEISVKKDLVGTCGLKAIQVDSGAVRSVSEEKWDTCYRIAWAPNGHGFYMIGTKEAEGYSTRRDQVYYISYPEGRSRRLTTDGSRHQIASLGVTNGNSVLAVPFNRSSQIWAMDPSGDSRTAVQLTSGLADGRAGLAPLADGRVSYIARTGDTLNVWVMNQDGSDQKQVTVDPPIVEELRSSNGRYLVYSAPQGRFGHLFRINQDGTDPKQLTFGDSDEGDSSLSNDGNWVVYDSVIFRDGQNDHTLWKVPIDGGEPVNLNRENCVTPHFSPDDKFISCVENDKTLTILSSSNGAFIRSFPAVPVPALNIGARWTPDGKALAYLVFKKDATNVWLQPIDGKPPRQLTDFTSGSTYNFAYSHDGTRLYLARGQQIRDAVLIKNAS